LWKQWERHVEGEKARRKASVNKLGYYRD
jgi:hypothetical protein